uniref:Uncharacterized protein n=1 Tax=Arion vulgaris TaxID=1028688 RepID=A0A0B6ZPL8_9EUPU
MGGENCTMITETHGFQRKAPNAYDLYVLKTGVVILIQSTFCRDNISAWDSATESDKK